MRVLREQDFRNLFLGQAASTIGDHIAFVALALYVTDIGSPTDVGLVLTAPGVLPLVVFLLLGGVWADRLPRHPRDDRDGRRPLRPARGCSRH